MDFRENCLPLVYVYDYAAEGLTEAFATDGAEIAFGQTDGIDAIVYAGTVSSRTTAALQAASLNQGPFVVLGRSSTGVIRSEGLVLDITVKLGGKTFKFLGARYRETVLMTPVTAPPSAGSFLERSVYGMVARQIEVQKQLHTDAAARSCRQP